MLILQRVRNFHDDVVFRYLPELRQFAPIVLSAVFVLALATMLVTTLLGGTANGSSHREHAAVAEPSLGAQLRLSRLPDRAETDVETARNLVSEADASDPGGPMVVEIDPESVAVHASAGTIVVRGTPIDVGNWPLD